MKKGIRFLSVFVAIIVLISSVFAGCKNNEDEQTGTNVETDEHNQTGISVDGIKISWANMKIDNDDLKLTEDQKIVLKYFDNDYFPLGDYDALQRYPKVFRHLQVEVNALIVKMLETNDDTYTCLAKLFTGADMYGETGENYELNENYIIIRGPQPNSGRIVEGDKITMYGRYMDVEKYEIDGKEKFYPTFNAFYYLQSYGKFDAKDIKEVAKIVFGQDIKLEDPMSSPNYGLDKNHYNGYLYYLVTLDNQTNANFSSFEFNRMYGYICDANYKDNVERSFAVSADFEHYIITIFDKNLNTICLEYYDRDFKKIWSREFEDAESLTMDHTAESIYLITNNDFYGIDISNGKDLFDPVYFGEKVRVNIVDDGVILVGTGNKDNIMKTDFKGKLIWKNSIGLEVESCSTLQIIDGNIVGFYMENSGDYRSVMASVDKEGNIIEEFDVELVPAF